MVAQLVQAAFGRSYLACQEVAREELIDESVTADCGEAYGSPRLFQMNR